MCIQQYLQYIQEIVPEISQTELQLFAKNLSIETLSAKQHFLISGQICTHMFFVTQGLLKIYYIDTQGEKVNVNFIQPFEHGGDYHSFLTQNVSRYHIQAIHESTIITCSIENFQLFCKQNPLFYKYLNYISTQALFSYLHRTEMFLIADAKTRYMQFLQQHQQLARQLSISDLCSYLGIQRQSLTRIRKQLK